MFSFFLRCRHWGVALLAMASFFATTAWAATTEVTDAIGRKVKVNTPVQRVVVNFNYEEFTAVAGKDAWAKVVGISRAPWEGWRPVIFQRYSAVIPNLQTMPDVGHSDDGTFSAEKVIALKPDVVFMAEWTFKSLQTAREQIEKAGFVVVSQSNVLDNPADDHTLSVRDPSLSRATDQFFFVVRKP